MRKISGRYFEYRIFYLEEGGFHGLGCKNESFYSQRRQRNEVSNYQKRVKVFGVYAETSTIQAAAFEQVPQAIWPRIYTEWFPDSGYELTPGIQFEMYYGLASHENGFGEIWLPVRQKK